MFWLYILTNKTHSTLYVGVTRDIATRLHQHRLLNPATFTGKYRTTKLVFAESAEMAIDAIAREKQIKKWRREKKIALIESINPDWESIEPD